MAPSPTPIQASKVCYLLEGRARVKVLVIYAPPYAESPDKVVKARQA